MNFEGMGSAQHLNELERQAWITGDPKAPLLAALAEQNQFSIFISNHADAIAEVVRAAEKMRGHGGSCQRAMEQSGMNDALANLEKEKS